MDGSCKSVTPKGGTTTRQYTGTGLYRHNTGNDEDDMIQIDPVGIEITNTINRAEMVAPYAWLRNLMDDEPDCPTAALGDSLCTLQLISKALKRPYATNLSLHDRVLAEIVELLKQKARQGTKIYIAKVKAHIGVHGNEMADRAANKAADAQHNGKIDEVKYSISLGNDPLADKLWPYHKPPTEGEQPSFAVANLHDSLKKQLCHKCHKGYTKPTIYSNLHDNLVPDMHLPTANISTTTKPKNITYPMKRNVLRYKTGTLWNAKLAQRFKRPYGAHPTHLHRGQGMCPHCGNPDSGSHIAAACSHPYMKGLYIQRHNELTIIIAEALSRGKHGGGIVAIDAGSTALAAGLTHQSRIPMEVTLDIPDEDRNKMRPDILLIKNRDAREPICLSSLTDESHRSNAHVFIGEISCGADTRYHTKFTEKLEQHARLKEALQRKQYAKVEVLPLIIGVAGTTYMSCYENLLTLGLERPAAIACMTKLHFCSVRRLDQIIRTRRHMDHNPFGTGLPVGGVG